MAGADAMHDVVLTDAQTAIVKRDLGLPGTWWTIMSRPRSFFVRAGVHAGNYGDDLLFSSGQGPNAITFYLALMAASLVITMVASGSFLAGTAALFRALFGVVGMMIGFFVASGLTYLVAKIFRMPGDFEAAQGLVAFTYAPALLMSFGAMLAYIPAVVGYLYWILLIYFGFRHLYRASIIRSLGAMVLFFGITVIPAAFLAAMMV